MKTVEERKQRLIKYEQQTSSAMLVLSLLYIVLYAIEVIPNGLNQVALHFILVFSNFIWASFIIDMIIRTYLAPNRIQYLLKHPIDVLALVLPAFRALRALRVITAGQWLLTRGSHLAVERTATAIVFGAGLLALVGSLAMLDAERNDPAASIKTFGDAVWWAFVTMSTVGYGDLYPVTTTGKVVAVMMMVVGVALLGLVSGTIVSALLDKIRGGEEKEVTILLNRIDGLEMKIDQLTAVLGSNSFNREEITKQ
jgi:voltage-gated potassium channel